MNSKKFFIHFLLLLVVLFFWGCENSFISGESASQKMLPLKVGNKWFFEDKITMQSFTLQVDSAYIKDGNVIFVLNSRILGSREFFYVGDTLFANTYAGPQLYNIPGGSKYGAHSTYRIDELTVPAGRFYDVIKIFGGYSTGNSYSFYEYYLSRGIGLLERKYNYSNGGRDSINEHWVLIGTEFN